jgi:hypothetical protein
MLSSRFGPPKDQLQGKRLGAAAALAAGGCWPRGAARGEPLQHRAGRAPCRAHLQERVHAPVLQSDVDQPPKHHTSAAAAACQLHAVGGPGQAQD